MTGPPVHNSHQNPDYPMVESHGSTCDFILAFLDLSNQIIGLTGMYWFRHQFHSTESNIPASIEDMYALFHNSNCSFPFMVLFVPVDHSFGSEHTISTNM